jgi:hypothetical protein
VVVDCLDGELAGGVRWPGSDAHEGGPVGRGLVAPGFPAQTLVPTILACFPARVGVGGVSLPHVCGVPGGRDDSGSLAGGVVEVRR